MKIAIVFDKLLYGGIERLGTIYSKFLCDAGHIVHIYILDSITEEIINDFDPRCSIIVKDINPKFCSENHWTLISDCDKHGLEVIQQAFRYVVLKTLEPILLKKHAFYKEYYDVAVAFSGHIKDLTLVADNYIKSKNKVAWLHGSEYSYNMLSPGFFRLYRHIKNLVCLSDLGDADCHKFNSLFAIKKTKIYNPCIIDATRINESKVQALKAQYGDYCLMVGRLSNDKNQELLINVFSFLVLNYGFNSKLLFVGDGPNHDYLQHLIEDKGLQNSVYLLGNKKDVENYYKAAKVYLHASPLEGLPMVFLEAMSFGLPIISTDAIPGAREILGTNNEYGIIVQDNIEEIAKTIISVYLDKSLYESLKAKSLKRKNDFDKNHIRNQLLEYFEAINNAQ